MKLKIKSSAKIKRRHLLLEANNQSEVEKAILDYIGILGWAKAAPIFIDSKSNIILSVSTKELSNVRAAIELSNFRIKIIKVSGTLKALTR
ncbi:MAG: hypothetical protein AABX73_02885 [Nanoarchaeota archaeon]